MNPRDSSILNCVHRHVFKLTLPKLLHCVTEGQQMYEFHAGGYCSKSVTIALVTGAPLSLAQVEVFGTGATGK